MSEEQKKQFDTISKSLIEWLCVNGRPHMSIMITPTSAELLEGQMALYTNEFVKD